MSWFTKADVKNASDVFLAWFGRVSGVTVNQYDDQIHAILQGQQDNFVNLIAKVLNLDVAKNPNASRAVVTVADLQAVFPGITDNDVAGLDESGMAALQAIGELVKK